MLSCLHDQENCARCGTRLVFLEGIWALACPCCDAEAITDAQVPPAVMEPTQRRIMNALAEGPMTRATLVARTKTARTTLYDNLVKLMRWNLVARHPAPRTTKGRPQVLFELVNPREAK